jgi:lambda family phage portal protein
MSYAQVQSGLILPYDVARQVTADFLLSSGAYRTANSSNRSTAGWVTSPGSADSDTLGDLQTLRQQSSDLIRNEALPAGIIAGNVTAVVGTGIAPQSRIDYEFLGLTEEEADAWQRKAERLFCAMADKPHWDAEHRQTFWQQQATVQRSMKERGDVFAVRRMIERPGKKLGLAVQLVESDRVATPPAKSSDRNIRAGCETDSNGAPVAWHINQLHPGERFMAQPVADAWTRIEAHDANGDPLVLPVIPRLRPGQTRGVPYLAPVIEMFKQLTRYTEAEINAAVISGMLAIMVTSPAPVSPLGGGIPGMVNGKPSTTASNKITRLQSGMILDLAPGEDVRVVDSTRPNPSFDPFVMSVLRQIGAGLELPFEVLVKHFQSSYSAARAAIMDAWRFFMKERDFLVQSFCQPCWCWVITEAVARGELSAPGFFDDPLIRAAWTGADWVGQGVPQIDPLKEAGAAEAWNNLGIWSLQDIAAQQGRDWDRTHRQQVRERRMRMADGLVQPVVADAQQQQQQRATMISELLKDDV